MTDRLKKLLVLGVFVGIGTAAIVAASRNDHGTPPSPKTATPFDESMKMAARPSIGIIVRDAKRAGQRTGVSTRREADNVVQLPNGQWATKNLDGTFTVDTAMFEPDESTIEGALSIRVMMRDHEREVGILQSGITTTRNERDQCLLEFAQRGGTIKSQYEWTIGLTFIGDGQEIRVAKVQALRDRWPQEFDEDAKDCYLESFARLRFASNEKVDMTVEFPLCVYPPIEVKDKNEQEH